MSDEFQDMWQAQNPEPFRMSAAEVAERARRLQRRIRWRNAREYLAAAAVLPVCVFWMWKLPNPIMRAGAGIMAASLLYIIYQLHKRGGSREMTGDCYGYYREELVRQRDAVASVWRWYLGPMIPGLLVMTLGSLYHSNRRHTWFVWSYLAVCAVFFYFVGKLNERAARKLQQKIEELDRLR